jgi:hemerythrin-like metal-binding protein
MSLITWNSRLSVGVEEIDAQHQKLVQLINGLHNHMVAGDARDIMSKVLDRVVEYTGFHFDTERRLMAEYHYPEAPRHLAEHDKLAHSAVDLQEKVRMGQAHITMETMKFLRDWLQHHILESDKELGAFLKAKGLS